MLFVLFQTGNDRFALAARRVVEIVPFLELTPLPQAPKGVAGLFNYRGRPVPAIDLCELTRGVPAAERLSTRIVIVHHPDASGGLCLLGLIAEHVTQIARFEQNEFVDTGMRIPAAPYLGPVLMDSLGPVQYLYEQRLLSEPVQSLLFSRSVVLQPETP